MTKYGKYDKGGKVKVGLVWRRQMRKTEVNRKIC